MANENTADKKNTVAVTAGQSPGERSARDYVVLAFPVGAVLAGVVQVVLWNVPPVEAFLLAFLVFVAGLQGVWAFLGHYFKSDEVAAFIGWPAGNPFQREVAFANLSSVPRKAG